MYLFTNISIFMTKAHLRGKRMGEKWVFKSKGGEGNGLLSCEARCAREKMMEN
jgi:hypothetical protein